MLPSRCSGSVSEEALRCRLVQARRGGRLRQPRRDVASVIALLALGVILSTALALRVLGVRFGLPAVYNPDEVAIMSRALAFAQGDLNPHNFVYPTLYFYLLYGWIGAYFAGGWLVGVFPSVSAFQQRFFIDPTGVFLAGRFLSVLLGVAGVFVTYRLARRAFGRPAGLAAAAFLATAPFHVRDSHYVKHDIPATLAIAAAILAIIWFADTPRDSEARTRRLVWASALSGVAFSIHYYAVFLAAPLLLAICVSGETRPRTLLRHVVLSGGIALAVFFVCSPFLLVEPGTALNDIVANRRIVVDRAVRTSAGAFPYLGYLRRDVVGGCHRPYRRCAGRCRWSGLRRLLVAVGVDPVGLPDRVLRVRDAHRAGDAVSDPHPPGRGRSCRPRGRLAC